MKAKAKRYMVWCSRAAIALKSKLYMLVAAIYTRLFVRRYPEHTTVDILPMYNWMMAKEMGEQHYLLMLKDYDRKIKCRNNLAELFEKIEMQVSDLSEIEEDSQELLRKDRELLLMRIRMFLKKEKQLLTKYKIKQNDFDRYIESTKKSTVEIDKLKSSIIYQTAVMEKHMKFAIDLKSTSVRRWYSYVDIMQREAKEYQKNKLKSK